ncbi:hypothetical protein [Nodularia sphaerocarpa]|uniref:hypothetical protein n=2 Tax=Nodularia sphaerocarpa TaxID=137816 RepID=UPI001EFB9922|nr:hypothetical protein [Nodularia sphaerocarpa]
MVNRVMLLQKLGWMTGVALVWVSLPALAEDHQKSRDKTAQLNNIEQSATSIQQLLAQSLIQVTGVNLQATDTGLEVILVTNQ